MSEFKYLRKSNQLRDAEWNPKSVLSLSFRGNELAGEIGEVCNLLKKLDRAMLGLVGSRTTKEALAEELADVVICVDLIAMELDISLFKAIVDKFNKTSIEHGISVMMGIEQVDS